MGDEPEYQPEQVVTTADEVLATLGGPMESQVKKVIDHIDDHCRAWIERSPFVVISTASADGAMAVSPNGDPAGFGRLMNASLLHWRLVRVARFSARPAISWPRPSAGTLNVRCGPTLKARKPTRMVFGRRHRRGLYRGETRAERIETTRIGEFAKSAQ